MTGRSKKDIHKEISELETRLTDLSQERDQITRRLTELNSELAMPPSAETTSKKIEYDEDALSQLDDVSI